MRKMLYLTSWEVRPEADPSIPPRSIGRRPWTQTDQTLDKALELDVT